MNSFTLHAVGTLVRDPEKVRKGEITLVQFGLKGTDYAGKDENSQDRYIVNKLWFFAFGEIANELLKNARQDDQLFVEARPRVNDGYKARDLDFIVTGFRYGARRGDVLPPPSAAIRRPPNPTDGATEETTIAVV